jgi:hypothetical protein
MKCFTPEMSDERGCADRVQKTADYSRIGQVSWYIGAGSTLTH